MDLVKKEKENHYKFIAMFTNLKKKKFERYFLQIIEYFIANSLTHQKHLELDTLELVCSQINIKMEQ